MRFNWRAVLVLLGFVALAVVAYFNWDDISKAWHLTEGASWQILLAIPVLQMLAFLINAYYYHVMYKIFDYHVPVGRLNNLMYALNFVNMITPSLGATAVSLMYYGQRRQLPVGKVALAQYTRYLLTYASGALLLGIAVLLVYLTGDIGAIASKVVLVVMLSSLLAVGLFLYAIVNKQRFNKLTYFTMRVVNGIGRKLHRAKPLVAKERIDHLLKEFNTGFDLLRSNPGCLRFPFLIIFTGAVAEAAVLYTVFVALGYALNPGVVIIGIMVANGASLFSIIPGDLGVYEVAMVAGFNGIGVPVSVAISSTLIFRLVNKILFLPVGFYVYSRVIGGKDHLPTPQKPN